MMKVSITALVVGSVMTLAACKQQGDSTTAAASRSGDTVEVAGCQLSPAQAKLLSSSGEFQQLEKVELNSLSAAEKSALQTVKTAQECSTTELSSLSESFPSVAAAFSKPAGADASTTAMALGGDMMDRGVVRTDYIIMPKTGTRYLAGYNSDGIIVLLQRLMQYRPR
jgi:hypothetical protein